MAKIPKDLSMRLRPQDRKSVGEIVSYYRKKDQLGRFATVSDCLRKCWEEFAAQHCESVVTFAPASANGESDGDA